MPARIPSKNEILDSYKEICSAHEKFLEQHGVKLPALTGADKAYKKRGLALVLFAFNEGIPVSKSELGEFLRKMGVPSQDPQEGRHLGKQSGWNIASGRRGDLRIQLKDDEYCLLNLTEPYPTFRANGHRAPRAGMDFDAIKAAFGNRCATCGSLEDSPNFLDPSRETRLQKGHMDPNLPLDPENTIPQCGECNQAYLDKFIFDEKGRVRDINLLSPRWRNKYRLNK